MAWRTLDIGESRWNVSIAAERRAATQTWTLVLSFRPATAGGRAFWTEYPLEASSRSMLYVQAEKIPDDRLAALVAERIG